MHYSGHEVLIVALLSNEGKCADSPEHSLFAHTQYGSVERLGDMESLLNQLLIWRLMD